MLTHMSHLSASQLHSIAALSLAQRATLKGLLAIRLPFTYSFAIARNA